MGQERRRGKIRESNKKVPDFADSGWRDFEPQVEEKVAGTARIV
jgi:hypothetical protein